MGAPEGNKNAVGNKGGGRKSAYQEKANAELLHEMFFTPQDREEIQAKLKTGKYSLKDLFVSKGYAGNERVLLALFNKNFPDDLLAAEYNKKAAADGLGLAPDAIKSVEDIRALIEKTINNIGTDSMTIQAASNVARLASIALKAIEISELDKKMDLVNSVIQQRKVKIRK